MASSQDLIPILDIRDDLVFLKDGSVSLVMVTSAVNFSLLFETEQVSIIDSFAGMLNSLSFPIQIVIRSKKMDVTSYLEVIDKAYEKQANPLLKKMTMYYRKFAESTIKENNVLDKQFYVVVKAIPIEMGLLTSSPAEKTKRGATLLNPRRDHVIRQLSRLGLKVKQLTTPELVKLFYDIYNPEEYSIPIAAPSGPLTPQPVPVKTVPPATPLVQKQQPQIRRYPYAQSQTPPQPTMPVVAPAPNVMPPTPTPTSPFITPVIKKTVPPPVKLTRAPATPYFQPTISPLTPPFVVEELNDELPA